MCRSIAVAVPLIAIFAVHAEACAPIKFALGASSATVTGTAKSDEPFACYTLATGHGQTATLRLIHGPKDDVAFTIHDIVDDRDSYTFKTEAKTYTVDVFRTFARERDEPFTMQVSVK